jgi:tripartite-type tricarboxylate transporter receptor subunit TctC
MQRRHLVPLLFALLPLAGAAQTPLAGGRPVTLLVGYAAGGPVDATARVLAVALGKAAGQSFIVDNRGGASGMLAAAQLQRAAPDGATLMLAASPTFTMTPHIQSSKAANPLPGLVPVAQVVEYANVLLVNPALPVKTLAEFVAYAKARPGEVNYGSSGVGSSNHLSAALLGSLTGTTLTHVPYKGNAPAMADLMGGQINFLFDIVNTAVPQVQAGKVRALAITSRTRNDALPDVPTAIEAGVPGLALAGWFGLVAPPGTPPAIVEQVQGLMKKVSEDPAVAARLKEMGYTVSFLPAPAFADRIRSDHAIWGKVVKDAKIERAD